VSGRWEFLRYFERPQAPTVSWARVEPFLAVGAKFAAASTAEVQEALDEWDTELATIDGDPSREDWSRFRPLRLSREEAWADWLAHLLELSPHFASRLLRHSNIGLERVEREVVTPGADEIDRRLDIVVCWSSAVFTHVEIKVGDGAFEKTIDTSRSIELHRPGTWQHVLLVPPEDESDALSEVEESAPSIAVMTWQQVATTLRACLWSGCGGVSWRVPARAFLGSVEQRLLHAGRASRSSTRVRNAPLILELLTRGKHDRHGK
jgi:hypothetical protein